MMISSLWRGRAPCRSSSFRRLISCGRTPLPNLFLSAHPINFPNTPQMRFSSTSDTNQTPPPINQTSSSQSTSADQEAMDYLLDEIHVILGRPVPIGSLFRALSAKSRHILMQKKVPLEQLLLRYPKNFAVYRQRSGRNVVIFCAPPNLVPAGATLIVPETTFTSDVDARLLTSDPIAEKQRSIHQVLQYIPNEWSPFTELGIPEEVRVRCMGKPNVKAFEYFQKHPQYFEVRQQGKAEHTFYVRRSLVLQRKMGTNK